MRIRAEWHSLKRVMMHRPGIEIDYAMLSPRPFLFERPYRTRIAVQEHENLENTLKENGVKVEILRDYVIQKADSDPIFRKSLEEKVMGIVRFYGTVISSKAARSEMEKNLRILDSSTLFTTITLEPSIDLKHEAGMQIEYPTVYSNLPLANLYFMRDQQAVTPNGVILGNMKRRQRMKEPEITGFVIKEAMGEKNIFSVKGDGIFEGGDFMPADKFCLIGIGSRTNMDGAMQAIKSGFLDYEEIGVVENPIYDFMENSPKDPMVNMHLDTYFNLAGEGVAVGSTELMQKARLTIYAGGKSDRGEILGRTTLYKYLKSHNYNFIHLGLSEQLAYSSNFLTISDRKIITVNVSSVLERLLREHVFPDYVEKEVVSDLNRRGKDSLFPHSNEMRDYGIDNIPVGLSELTGGYGGAHCMTAALER